ncbi:MAG: hypothetical protein JXA96_01345 [Sedimentisphaerales bacterium]|nr:hypothetical protein [Sedimentisphaerales bacterium]
MLKCSLAGKIKITEGTFSDYKELSKYHYRNERIGPFSNIFALKPQETSCLDVSIIGVIVYSMPNPCLELRNIATGNFFVGLDRKTQISLLNKTVRRISRIIIEPRFRGLGLASHLVRKTMPLVNVPIIEASGVMGVANPFFEKAGMAAYKASPKTSCIRMIEAFEAVGIVDSMLINPMEVHSDIESLDTQRRHFIENEFRIFLKSFGNKRYCSHSLERTQFVLTRLTERPIYYIWFNSNSGLVARYSKDNMQDRLQPML